MISKQDPQVLLKKNDIFSELSPQIIDQIIQGSSVEYFNPSELVIDENKPVKAEFYVLLQGELEVIKKDEKNQDTLLNKIYPTTIFGEGVFFDETKRTASVQARTESHVLVIHKALMDTLMEKDANSMRVFIQKIHVQTFQYLKKVNNHVLQLMSFQKNLSYFLINIIVYLSVYAILMPFLMHFIKTQNSILVTTPLVFFGVILLFIRMQVQHIPLKLIGITKQNLKKSILEAFILSAVILLSWITLKYILIHCTERFADRPLFYFTYNRLVEGKRLYMDIYSYGATLIIYTIHAFFQEILARGSLQGLFQSLLPNRAAFWPIVLASLVFASAHSYFGLINVGFVFFQGLLWGKLYQRTENIFAPILSHILIGIIGLNFIGNV